MWRGFVGSCWLGPGCLVLRADTRENPVSKNWVMTVSLVLVLVLVSWTKLLVGIKQGCIVLIEFNLFLKNLNGKTLKVKGKRV